MSEYQLPVESSSHRLARRRQERDDLLRTLLFWVAPPVVGLVWAVLVLTLPEMLQLGLWLLIATPFLILFGFFYMKLEDAIDWLIYVLFGWMLRPFKRRRYDRGGFSGDPHDEQASDYSRAEVVPGVDPPESDWRVRER